jgi:PHD/YefM family antitoxin component YafN of YafNO toxin-antitoxin module
MSDWETLNSITAYHKLEEAKEKWAKAQEQVIILDEGKKAICLSAF